MQINIESRMVNALENPRLLHNAKWFVLLRWFVIVAAFIGVFIVNRYFNVILPFRKLYAVLFLMIIVNIVYYFIIKFKSLENKAFNITRLRLFLNIQVFIDLLLLTIILHYSGGIENPIIVFYIFHMILSGILLPRLDSFIQSSIALIFFFGLIILEYKKIIPHYTINEHLSDLLESDASYLTAALGIFTITSYMVVYLSSYVTKQLRQHEEELELLNRELKKKDKIKNEYVLRLTHDIKGHVSALKSNHEVIKREVYGEFNEGYIPFINGISQVLENLSMFIKDLLQLTRSKLRGNNEKEFLDIHTLLTNALEDIKSMADEKKISFITRITPGQKSLFVYALSAKEMLVNLFSNAIKYSSENSEVIIEVSPHNKKFALFKITDHGVGIPKKELSKLFSEFFRASNVKKSHEGSGLGLSIVKQIAANHDADAWVESEENAGSSFYVTLPYKY